MSSLIDSGCYRYQLNGEDTGIEEYWQRSGRIDGEYLVTSSRRAPGVMIEVEARMEGGLVNSFVVNWAAQDQPPLWAQYTFKGQLLQVQRRSGTEAADTRGITFPANSPTPLLSPLMRIFAGPLIARLLQAGGQGEVVVPAIGEPEKPEGLLQPLVSTRRATLLETGVQLVVAGSPVACRCCEYHGDQYGPGTRFWLGEDDLLVRYQWQQSPQQSWDVWLEREAGA